MAAGTATGDARERRAEIAVGAAALLLLAVLLALSLRGALGGAGGLRLQARFDHIDGLAVGSDVRIAGVKVGRVTAERVDPASFLATVEFTVPTGFRLPADSSAAIVSEGLLGGKFLSVSPGGGSRDLAPGGLITATQGSIGLEALLGKFIGSVTALTEAVKSSGMAGGAAARPAPRGRGLGPGAPPRAGPPPAAGWWRARRSCACWPRTSTSSRACCATCGTTRS
jgi:phospholipid/cholesterol/gamma-HCH transport system substrate-binding protein